MISLRITLASLLILSGAAFAQHEHMTSGPMHDHSAMGHKISKTAKLDVKDQPAPNSDGGQIVVRLGPISLPAHSDHMAVGQMPEFTLPIPIAGWITGYAPHLVNAKGEPLPNKMLHHIALWNTERSDFLCANKEEHIFGAGGEMNQWPVLPGIGYWVNKGDRIRIDTMFHNPTGGDYPETYLEFTMSYRAPEAKLKSVYPAWFDVKECGDSSYNLVPEKSVKTGVINMPHSGRLIGVGGHMHDYGTQLSLTRGESENLATLDAKRNEKGEIEEMPIVSFWEKGGLSLKQGDRMVTSATYANPTGMTLQEGAMGIVVGYFLPDNDAEMAAHKRSGKPAAAKATH